MKIKTFIDLLASGQFSLLLGLESILRQFYRSSFAAAALSEGLLALMRDQPASLDEIHRQLVGLPSESSAPGEEESRQKLKAWLDLGVLAGELNLTSSGYSLHGRLSRQLAQPSNDALAAMFEEAWTLHHDLITQTPARLRQKRLFALADTDGELIARSSRILEPYIFEIVDVVVPKKGAYHLLEVGCGSGVYMRRACLRNPDLLAVGLELQPDVADFARRNLEGWGLAQRVRVDSGDIRHYTSAERFDLVTLHNNIYYFPIDERLALLRRLSDFLKPGGRLVVSTACLGSLSTQILNLWAEMTAGAGALPQADAFCDLMSQAGFTAVKKTSLVAGEGFFAFEGLKA